MKQWTKEEIQQLLTSVDELGVAKGFRAHMATTGRTYQACSHQYYKNKKVQKAGTPTSINTKEPSHNVIVNFFKKLFGKQ